VNRCLTEGRRAFLKRVAGIETGAECARMAPLISKVADGEASPEEMRLVRPHLKGCLACKATLREYRATPARVAGLVPPVVALAGGSASGPGLLARLLERFAGIGDAAGAKVAAVSASAVVLAGGSAAGVEALHHDAPPVAPSAFAAIADGPASARPAPAQPSAAAAPASAPDPSAAAIDAISTRAADPGGPDPTPKEPVTDPLSEFDPSMAAGSAPVSGPAPVSRSAPASATAPASGSPTPSSGPASGSKQRSAAGSGAGEFGP
jgi:putative zinc finger protein